MTSVVLLSQFLISQDSHEDAEEAGALRKSQAPVMGAKRPEAAGPARPAEAGSLSPGGCEVHARPTGSGGPEHAPDALAVEASAEKGSLCEDETSVSLAAEEETREPVPTGGDGAEQPKRHPVTYSQIIKEGRRFNIDLVSKVSAGFAHLPTQQY